MPTIQAPSHNAPTIGLFAPCDPRIDDPSRERALNIVTMTAKILERIKLPMGHQLGIVTASKTVENEADADEIAAEFKAAGVAAICIVPDTWFYPGRTAIALTSHFARETPIACRWQLGSQTRRGRCRRRGRCPRPDRHLCQPSSATCLKSARIPNSATRPRMRSST